MPRGQPPDSKIAPLLRALSAADQDARWKELTELFLHELCVPVTQRVAAALAPSGGDLPRSVMHGAEEFGLWLPVAQASVLLLVDWLVDRARQGREVSEALTTNAWVQQAMDELYDPTRFKRATALEAPEARLALEATAEAIASWEPILAGVPMRYLGQKVVLRSDGAGMTCTRLPGATGPARLIG